MGHENRERLRVDLTKLAFAKEGQEARAGLISNLSASGTRIRFVNPLSEVAHPYKKDDGIELVIDGMTPLKGKVVWVSKEEIAIGFNLSTEEEKRLISEIMVEMSEDDLELS